MAIKHGSKVDKSFSSASMTDLMFLLLLFLLIATTLINPNALKLMLPKSSNTLKDKALTTVSVQDAGRGTYNYFVELENVGSAAGVERALKTRLEGQVEPTVSLHLDKTVPVDELTKLMNIGKRNNYKMILATSPE
ncbi:MAG: biopolymer transporter ExbD [Alistipes sp.]|nr:biopolymer transporter ExbD [Alistipes sp.]MDE6779519.1 biopolymer transporter ExbD [Alistipes sp.]